MGSAGAGRCRSGGGILKDIGLLVIRLTGGATFAFGARLSGFVRRGLGRVDKSTSAREADDLALCGILLVSKCLSDDDDLRLMVLPGPFGEK